MADTERLRLLRRMVLDSLRAAQVGTARGWMSAETLRRIVNQWDGDYSPSEVGSALVFLTGKGYCEEKRQVPSEIERFGRAWAITPSGVELLDGTIERDASIA